MISVKTDSVYTAARKISGSSDKGDWVLLKVLDENGRNGISLFARNLPCEINEGEPFKVEKIYSVSSKNKQDKNGVWRTDVSVDADVIPAETRPGTSFEKAVRQLKAAIKQ